MTLTINIPDTVAQSIIDDYARAMSYPETVMGQPNPESKAAYAKRMLIQHIKQTVRSARTQDAVAVIVDELNNTEIT